MRYLFAIWLLVAACAAKGSHITGAYFSYECIGTNQYVLTYNEIWRCSAGSPITFASISSSNDCGHNNISGTMPLVSVQPITQACPSQLTTCTGGTTEGFQLATYSATYTLDGPCDSWQFYKASCCTYLGLVNQPTTAFYYETVMHSVTEPCNSSAYPLNPGAPNYYLFEQVLHDFSFVDPDGDSLVYSLVPSRTNASTNRPYNAPYTGAVPMDNMQINPNTGEIAFMEDLTGNFIINIKVDEYRNGVLVGSVYYETMIAITNGVIGNVAPDSQGISNISGATQISSSEVETCGDTVSFDVTFDDFNVGDILSISSNINSLFPGAIVTVTGQNPVTANLKFFVPPTTQGYFNISVTCQDDYCPYYKSTTAVIGLRAHPGVNIALTPTNVTCYGDADGAVQVSGSNGTQPYYYTNDGFTFVGPLSGSYTFNGLSGGTQNFLVQDANGCTASATTNLFEPSLLSATLAQHVDPTCNGGGDGTFTVQASGGSPALNYCLNGGPISVWDTNVESVQLTGNTSNINYTGCPGVVGVEDQTVLSADLTAGNAYTLNVQFGTCNSNYFGSGQAWIDFNSNGVFEASESIGTWSGTPPTAPNAFFFVVPPGAVNGTVRMRVNQQEGSSLPLNPCAAFNWGSSTDFSIEISGGTGVPTGDYTFSIDAGINTQTSPQFTGQSAGFYVVDITDINGCAAILPVQLNEPTQTIATVDSVNDITCFGLLDGEAYASAYNLDASYCQPVYETPSCQWPDMIHNFTIADGSGNNYDNLTTGCAISGSNFSDYTSDTITLTPGDNCSVSLGAGNFGQGMVLFIDYNRDGDFNDTGEYQNVGFSPAFGTATTSFTLPTNIGGYTRLRVMSVFSGSQHYPLQQDDACGFINGNSSDAGEFEDYTVYFGDPFTYSFNAGAFTNPGAFLGEGAGPFTITVQDQNGCLTNVNGSITEPTQIISTIDATVDELCENFGDGSLQGSGSGGTIISGSNPYLYEIIGPSPAGPQTSGFFPNLPPGAYDFVVTDANSCSDTSSFTIGGGTMSPVPFSNNLDPTYTDNHPDIPLYPTSTPIPTLPITYSFSGDGVWSDTLHPSALSPGSYEVVYSYGDGTCTFTDTSTFNIISGIDNIQINKTVPSDPWVFCFGETGTYSLEGIALSKYGGNFLDTASYLNSAYIPHPPFPTGPFTDTVPATLLNLDQLPAGQYPIRFYTYVPVYSADSVAGTSTFIGWDSVYTEKIFTIRQLVPGSIQGLGQDYCEGEPGGLLSVSGQSAFPFVATSFTWTNSNGGFLAPSLVDPIFDPSTIGVGDSTIVWYILSDDEGYCIDSASSIVYYHPKPALNIVGITDTVCSYFSDTLQSSLGAGTFSNAGGFISNIGNGAAVFDVSGSAPGGHWLTSVLYSHEYFPGCTVDSTLNVTVMPDASPVFTVNDAIGSPVSNITPLEICHDDSVTFFANTITPPGAVGFFPWDSTLVGAAPLIGNNVSSIAVTTQYPFYHLFDDGMNQCPYYDTVEVTVFPLPTIAILGLTQVYCSAEDSSALTLLPNDNGVLTMAHDGTVDTLSSNAPYMNPGSYISDTLFVANYHYTDSLSGCSNDFTDSLLVYESPIADFQVLDSCAMSITTFVNTSIGVPTSLIWDLDDGGAAVGDTVSYTYPAAGIQIVDLTISTSTCSDTKTDTINLGGPPRADFTYDYGCFDAGGVHGNPPAQFYDGSSQNGSTGLVSWSWNFGDPGTLADTSILDTTNYAYNATGSYSVTLVVANTLGCRDTVSRDLSILPYISLLDTASPLPGYQRTYYDDLENAIPEWLVDDLNSVNSSWEWGAPNAIIDTAASGLNAYVTSLSGSYNDNETSYVYGPCFDLSRLKRPMIKLNTWSDIIDFGPAFDSNDGAHLEYWTSTRGWTPLGNLADGINWYNNDIIYSGDLATPDTVLGWSGKELGWKDSRYKLDEIDDGSQSDTLVKFRIVFHSDSVLVDGGFAFDDIWIGERTKRVLVEHFTNILDPLADTYTPRLDSAMDVHIADAIDIQYHTESPANDPMWQFYSAGPNSRSLYYSTGNMVPYSINDGNVYENPTANWLADRAALEANSLLDAGFIVDLTNVNINTSTGQVYVRVKLEALKTILGENIRVHIALVEQGVNFDGYGSHNVVRRMLPDPSGAALPWLDVYQYDTLTMPMESWTFNPLDVNMDSIRVVAFVQNYDTREVYQAADGANYLLATEVAELDEDLDFIIYPNPAREEAWIGLDEQDFSRTLRVHVYNAVGKMVVVETMRSRTHRLDTAPLAAGLYHVRVLSGDEVVGAKKLVVR